MKRTKADIYSKVVSITNSFVGNFIYFGLKNTRWDGNRAQTNNLKKIPDINDTSFTKTLVYTVDTDKSSLFEHMPFVSHSIACKYKKKKQIAHGSGYQSILKNVDISINLLLYFSLEHYRSLSKTVFMKILRSVRTLKLISVLLCSATLGFLIVWHCRPHYVMRRLNVLSIVLIWFRKL